MITTAVKEDRPVHVSEVRQGLACGCVCEDCGGNLIAKKGQRREHHFAHYIETNCGGEGNLHRMAKRILVEERRLTIGHAELDSPVVQIFETAEDEVPRGKVRVDCLMKIGDIKNQLPIDITELAVEIKVTHAVDEKKKAELRKLGLQTIEINLADLVQLDSTLSLNDIRKAICDTPSNITWIDLATPESTQQELVLDQESESPTVERPCPDCGAELSAEAPVCTSCGTIQDETDIQLSENRPEPPPKGVGPETRDTFDADGVRRWKQTIKQYKQTGILASPGSIPIERYQTSTKTKRAGKRTNRKKRKR